MTDNLFVVTGGPGSGKSSLVAALAAAGLHHMPEAGRLTIQDQVSIGGEALPWSDRQAFAELMLAWDLRSHHEARTLSGPVICDRGVPDTLGFLILSGLPVPEHVRRAADLFRYNKTVFVAPHWPGIFLQDAERKQNEVEAAATEQVMREVYASLGYELVTLPLASVADRADFVRETIAARLTPH